MAERSATEWEPERSRERSGRKLLSALAREKRVVPCVGLIAAILIGALLAPWIAPYSSTKIDLSAVLEPPGPGHWLGTDELGRDLLSRLLFGARVSFLVATLAVALSLLVGTSLGMVAGFRGGWVDNVLMRCVDALLAFPSIVLAVAVAATIGAGLRAVVLAIAVHAIPVFARLVRGQVLQIKQEEYIEASYSIGCSEGYILVRHVLPNLVSVLIIQSTLSVGLAILLEATISYLGVGVQPPVPSWGIMIKVGSGYLSVAPWLVMVPGAAIFVSVLALNLTGDALRDVLDPRLRR